MAINSSHGSDGFAQSGDSGRKDSVLTPGMGNLWPRRSRSLPTTAGNVLLMLFVVALSGNPVLSTPGVSRIITPVAATLIGLAVLDKEKISGLNRAILVTVLFGTIFAVQTVDFKLFPAVTILGLVCRFVIAFSIAVLIADFAGTYVRVMLGLATLGLFFYSFYHLGGLLGINVESLTKHFEIPAFMNEGAWSIGLHTYSTNPNDVNRNAGMFWEPGAFAGYLNLALVLLCLIRARYTAQGFFIRFLVLSLCLLTTQSTIGYIAYALVLSLEAITGARRMTRARVIRYFCTFAALAIGGAFVANQEFMAPKIMQSVFASTTRTGTWQADRLGTLIFDLDYITQRPLTGWGMVDETRMALHPELIGDAVTGRGNGMSDYAARFGVIALGAWLVTTYQTLLILSSKQKMAAILGVFVIVLSLNDECFLNFPLFLIFFFSLNPGAPLTQRQTTVAPTRNRAPVTP
jgi:hypothetical protein